MKRNLVIGIWGAAAFIAVLAGIAAVSIAQGGLLPQQAQPMSQEEIQRELDQEDAEEGTQDEPTEETTEPTEEEDGDSTDFPTPEGDVETEGQLDSVGDGDNPTSKHERIINTEGGTVMARCDGDQAELVWWVPEQGFVIDDLDRGPDDDVEIEFENEHVEIEIEVECKNERPIPDIDVDR